MDPIAPSPRRSSFRSFVLSYRKSPVITGDISKPRMCIAMRLCRIRRLLCGLAEVRKRARMRRLKRLVISLLGSRDPVVIAERDRVCGG
jgi:hypothetical protein